MAKLNVNIGLSVNDKTGDTLRSAFDKINQNFTELYNATGGIDLLAVASNIVPDTDNTRTLGTPTKRWGHLYVGPGSISIGNAELTLEGGKIKSSTGFKLTDSQLDDVLPSQTGNAGKFLTTDGNHILSWAVASGGTTDYNNLTNKPTIPSAYTLPTASSSVLGGIKIGTGLSIDVNGVVTASSGSVSSLVNSTKTVSLGSTGTLSLPAGPTPLTNVNQIVSAIIDRTGASTDTDAIAAARDTWIGLELNFTNIRDQDEQIFSGTRPWVGLPSWEAYPLITTYQPTGGQLPAPSNLPPATQNAINAYLAYKELVSNIDIVSGNKAFSFENTGALRVPGVITKDNSLILVSAGMSGVLPNEFSASVTVGGQYGRVYITTNDGATGSNRTWTFGTDGSLTFPNATAQTTAFTGTGNVGFRNDTIFDLAGLAINNSNQTTASTAGISIPANGSGVLSITNNAKTWGFDTNGNLTFTNGEQIKTNFLGGGIELYQSSDNTIGIYSGGAEIKTFATGGAKHTWTFGTNGTTTFPNNSIKNSLDNSTAIITQRTLTANNTYTNVTDFSTDVDLGSGNIIAGWYQRTAEQIEFALFGPSAFISYLTGLALGRTVIVTYNTSGGTSTLTRTLTQVFASTGQTDPNNPTWSRVSGRIDATLPVGQLGIVSINFPVYSTSTNDWTFGTNGNTTFPTGLTLGAPRGSGTVNFTSAIDKEFQIETQTASYSKLWRFETNGNTTLPTGLTFRKNGTPYSTITADLDKVLQIETQTSGGVKQWSLGTDGWLTLPANGVVQSNTLIALSSFNDTNNIARVICQSISNAPQVNLRTITSTGAQKDWVFSSAGTLTLPAGTSSIQSAVEGGFQASITLNPYRVLSQTVVPGNQSYSSSGDFVSATWTDTGFGGSTIAFTTPESYVVNFINTYLPRVSSITVRINGAGAEYPYTYSNGTNEIYLTGAPASLTAVTSIRFSYQRISKIHIEPDDGAFDIVSQPGTDIDIEAGGDLRLLAYDQLDITAGNRLQLRSGDDYISITTNHEVPNATPQVWQFGTNGGLTLPAGGVISEGGGISGAIKLKPAGGANAYQALLIYPTAGAPEGDHIHLTAGGGTTELYLGNDYHYVKLANNGNVVISVPNGVPSSVSNWVGQGGWNQGYYSNVATTGGTGTGLTVNVAAGGGGYINIGTITIANPGTGYTNGDVITINNENNLPGSFTIGVAGTRSWNFGTDGALTLPSGGAIDGNFVGGQWLDTWLTAPLGATKTAGVRDYYGKTVAFAKEDSFVIESNRAILPKVWTFSESGILTLPNGAVIRQSTNTEVTDAFVAYTAAIASWEYTRINDYLYSVNNVPGRSLEGWPFAGWDDVDGTTASAYLAIITNAQTIQNSAPSSPPTPLVFTPALSSIMYAEIRAVLLLVINTYAAWQALLTSVDIVAGAETLSLLSNNKIQVPGIIQTDIEEDITIRTRYAVPASPSGTTTANKDFVFGTNGTLTFTGTNTYDSSIQGDASGNLNLTAGNYVNIEAYSGAAITLAKYVANTSVDMGNATSPVRAFGDLWIMSGRNITTDNTTISIVNTNATTVNFAGAATTALNIGASGAPITGFARTATTSSTAESLGYLGMPQNAKSANANTVIGDQGKHIYITGPTIITIDGSLAYPIGTTITFINSTSTATIAITTNTMALAGVGTTGSRTLAPYGMATAIKVTSTLWYINGTGLT